ncbi:MAG: hypothetical protein CSA76_03835 [Spirochaetales bacterium]|nr:MAG: hypothetical protein CSA76_03835 [Spirochaetales bacterium]
MKKLTVILLLSGFSAVLWGQSNVFLDSFLEKDSADTGTSLLLLAQSLEELPLDAAPEDGYNWALEQDFAKYVETKSVDEPISLGLYYLALLKSYGVKGGLWFNWIGTPRQAVNEAAYMGYLDPSSLFYTRTMTPEEVLSAISYISADNYGGRK